MRKVPARAVCGVVASGVLILCECCSPPQAEIHGEAASITVNLGDGKVVELTKGSPSFEDISHEALRIVAAVDRGTGWIGVDFMFERQYPSAGYVQLDFVDPFGCH